MVCRMSLFIVAIVLTVVGAVLASNFNGLADRGARFNAAHRGLNVNSQASAWRFTGGVLIAVGVPLAIWAALQFLNVSELVGRLIFVAVGLLLVHDHIRWNRSWAYNGRFLGSWIRTQSVTAQILWRISMGIIGAGVLLTGLFGTPVPP